MADSRCARPDHRCVCRLRYAWDRSTLLHLERTRWIRILPLQLAKLAQDSSSEYRRCRDARTWQATLQPPSTRGSGESMMYGYPSSSFLPSNRYERDERTKLD